MTAIRKLDLANELGVRKSAVTAWLRKGLPVQPNGLVDREVALEWINRNVEPQIGSQQLKGGAKAGELLRKKRGTRGRTKGNNGHDVVLLDPAQERARRDRAMAERLERENLVAEGQLVWIDVVVTQVAGELAIVRNRLLSLPSKCAPHLAAASGPEQVRALLQNEIIQILCELSGAADAGDAAA